MRIKVLYVLYSMPKGGKERRFLELVKDLKNNPEIEYRIIVLTTFIQYPEIKTLPNLTVLDFKGRFLKFKYYRYLLRICREYKPQIIHAWGNTPSLLSGIIRTFNNGPETCASFINDVPPNGIKGSKLVLTKLVSWFNTCILSNTKLGLRVFNIPPHKGECIYNGFDFRRTKKLKNLAEIRNQFNITTRYVVGMMGAMEPRKDFIAYIRGAKEIIKRRRDIVFLLIGDGKMRDELEGLIAENEKSCIRFTGNLDHIESVINLLDVGVLLSNNAIHGEGISNTIMEYMALGLPVVATNGGGNPEIIADNISGYLVDNNDIDQVAQHIIHLVDNKDLAQSLGENGRKIIIEKFDMALMTRRFLHLYQEILSKK
jgi:glycosyltransferase involved in cell wall biosynthesis